MFSSRITVFYNIEQNLLGSDKQMLLYKYFRQSLLASLSGFD
jgi:hypothetical protein